MKKHIKFTIFCNRMFGETKSSLSIDDLFNKMTKRHKEHWSEIKFKDEQGRTIQITREFLEQGMTIEEIIEDWILNCQDRLKDEIFSIN